MAENSDRDKESQRKLAKSREGSSQFFAVNVSPAQSENSSIAQVNRI